jgi:hypothetical protein
MGPTLSPLKGGEGLTKGLRQIGTYPGNRAMHLSELKI